MTPEQQRIAIAEAYGFTGVLHAPTGFFSGWKDGQIKVIPDYLNDLNAMHEAEKRCLNRYTCHSFFDTLGLIAIKDWADCDGSPSYEGDGSYFEMWVIESATSAQRAEAFLRTLGKWKED